MIVGIGSPLANLADDWCLARLWSTSPDCPPIARLTEFRSCGLATAAPPVLFHRACSNRPNWKLQPNHHALFYGKKLALVKSRDDLPTWIWEWAYFLAEMSWQRCHPVLRHRLQRLRIGELQKTLASVHGIGQLWCVEQWPCA